MNSAVFHITTLGRPPTMNALIRASGAGKRGGHAVTREIKAWRHAAQAVSQYLGPMNLPVEIEAIPTQPDGRWAADTGAALPALKAVIDGLVDAGLIPDDGPDTVTAITMRRWELGPAGLLVKVSTAQLSLLE